MTPGQLKCVSLLALIVASATFCVGASEDKSSALPAVQAVALDYTPGAKSGYVLKAGEVNSLKLSMFTQLHFVVTKTEDDDNNNANDPADDLSFYVNRARLYLMGGFWDKAFTYRVSATYTGRNVQGAFYLSDAYFNMELAGKSAQLRIGQFKTPFNREFQPVSMDIFFVDRSLLFNMNTALTLRDDGAMVYGVLDIGDQRMFGYRVAIMDGRGANLSSPEAKGTINLSGTNVGLQESALMYVAMANIYFGDSPDGWIPEDGNLNMVEAVEAEIGVEVIWVNGTDGDTGNLRVPDQSAGQDGEDPGAFGFGVFAALRGYRHLAMNAEFIRRVTTTGVAGADTVDSRGVRAQLMYTFSRDIGAGGVRYVYWDPDANTQDDEYSEISVGWNKYFGNLGNSNRLSCNYILTRRKVVAGATVQNPQVSRMVVAWQIWL